MRVALVGPIASGKSTLFAAVVEAGGSHVDLSRGDQGHLGVVKVPDERVEWLRELYQRKKAVHAELEFIDLPGFDLSDPAGRRHAQVHWGAMRQSDMIVLVVRGFTDPSVPAYRNRVDPAADVGELLSEMLFADLEQVDNEMAMELSMCSPFDTEEQVKGFACDMAANKAKAKGQGISPILWTIAMRGGMSEKQYKAARHFLSYSVRRWRAVQSYLQGDEEGVRYATEMGYLA